MNIQQYKERQEAKQERYNYLSQKAEREAEQRRATSNIISSFIPMGQPILCGHHSEGRHRRDIERIQNNFSKSIELQEKAEYYKNKAENVLNDKSIRQDDPEAVKKLKEKIKMLEENNKKTKELNAKLRSYKSYSNALIKVKSLDDNNPEKKDLLKMLEQARFYANPPERINVYYLATVPNTAEIKRLNERIKEIENRGDIKEEEETINDITLKINKELNRVQIIFNSIPTEEIRAKLKHNGFRWSPFNKAWQSYINDHNIIFAKEIIRGGLNG